MRLLSSRSHGSCFCHLNWFGITLDGSVNQPGEVHACVIHRHVHIKKNVTDAVHVKNAFFLDVLYVASSLNRALHIYYTAPSRADRVRVERVEVVHQHADRPGIQNIKLGAQFSTLLRINQIGPHQLDSVSQMDKLSSQRSLSPLHNRPSAAVGCTATSALRGQAHVECHPCSCSGANCRSPAGSLAAPKLGDTKNAYRRASTERCSYGPEDHGTTNQFMNGANFFHTEIPLKSYCNSAITKESAHA